ncbi:hypothetical protein TWF694_009839 [Orbilia ellipsospora]|uniref:Uncharacterized protein n=1 Tax=Orbilia ellipsospora TaxID=2528407 RepID=A0AAV9XC17_9PEZI
MGSPKVGQFFGTVKKKVEEAGATIKLSGEKAKKSAQDIGGNIERVLHTMHDDASLKQNEFNHILGGAMQNLGGLLAKTGKGLQHQMHRDVPDVSSDEDSNSENSDEENSTDEEESSEPHNSMESWVSIDSMQSLGIFELGTQTETMDEDVIGRFTNIYEMESKAPGEPEIRLKLRELSNLDLDDRQEKDFARAVEILGTPVCELAVPLPELTGNENTQPSDEIVSPQVPEDSSMDDISSEPIFTEDFDWKTIYPFLADIDEINIPEDDDPLLNRRFLDAAWAALKKLHNATTREAASPQLKHFVEYQLGGIKGLRNIISTGLKALKSIFDGQIPSELSEVYCFLHVAYAISRSKKDARTEELPSLAFREDLNLFRRCLSSTSSTPEELSQQDIFDEIVKIMWTEFQEGLEWAKPRLPTVLSGEFDNLDQWMGLRDAIRSPLNLDQKSLKNNVKELLQSQLFPLATMPDSHSVPKVHTLSPVPTAHLEWPLPTLEDIFTTTIFQELLMGLHSMSPIFVTPRSYIWR